MVKSILHTNTQLHLVVVCNVDLIIRVNAHCQKYTIIATVIKANIGCYWLNAIQDWCYSNILNVLL